MPTLFARRLPHAVRRAGASDSDRGMTRRPRFDRVAGAGPAGRRGRSTCSSSAAASPAPASRSTPRRAACAPRWSSADDFASGTSSKSSKLVHGGLRYLQQKEYLPRLREPGRAPAAARQRAAPRRGRCPSSSRSSARTASSTRPSPRRYGTALWLYDLTGGLRIGKRHKRLSNDEAVAHMPTLRRDRLAAAFLYYDARADDARLTLDDRPHRGARPRRGGGQLRAGHRPRSKDGAGRSRRAARRRHRGAGRGRRQRHRRVGRRRPRPRRGRAPRHASVRPRASTSRCRGTRCRCDIAAVVPVPEGPALDLRRAVGRPRLPRHHRHRLRRARSTTRSARPRTSPTSSAPSTLFVTEPLTDDDVLGTWAGLRPLVKDAGSERTADLSRRHTVTHVDSGVVTVTGGKLTTYRKMAADTVDDVVKQLGRGRTRRSPTKKLRCAAPAPTEARRRARRRAGSSTCGRVTAARRASSRP